MDVARLLYPAAVSIIHSGIAQETASSIFTDLLAKAASEEGQRRFNRVGQHSRYADLVGRWSRDADFLGQDGTPRALYFQGKLGFRELVNRSCPGSDPKFVLTVLRRFRNVQVRDGKIALVQPYFSTTTSTDLAFEPLAVFLSDAARTIAGLIDRPKAKSSSAGFWRKVESLSATEAVAKSFDRYARRRSVQFLLELDEWLEAHARHKRPGRGKKRRIGIGLFSISSEAPGPSRKR